jgi:glycosyltransferase involved in cell wall biosynthesis
MDEVVDRALGTGIALTPHRLDPVPQDGALPHTDMLVRAGVFNAGFVAASPAGRSLLVQWWQAMRRGCVDDPHRHRYYDQRWLDQAIGLHPVDIVRDPGCNVGYWNVDTRPVRREGPTGWTAGGAPLRFFHYSGFDPRQPWMLSQHVAAAPRVPLSAAPDLADLCARYARQVLDAGWEEARRIPYGHGALPDGTPIDARMRHVFRTVLEQADAGRAPAPPNPFRAGEIESFWQLLDEPHPDHPRVSRYQYELWAERLDVAMAIGTLQQGAADRFLGWILDHGGEELNVPPRLLPERPLVTRFREASAGPPARKEGLAMAGLVGADVGVGQAARLAIEAARAAGLEPEVIGYDNTQSRMSHRHDAIVAAEAVADVALICLNPDVLSNFIDATWPQFQRDRRTVGLWFWEVDVPSASMERAFDLVDEVWVTTEHVRRALDPIATKPVELVPLPLISDGMIEPDDPRGQLGIPTDRFTFLFSYDTFSVSQRKNPLGLADAFMSAFSPGEGPQLVIKTINGGRDDVVEHLHHLARQRPDLIVLDRYISAAELHGLTAMADCYVSLHRAEGWGLTLAEAMAVGTPVIATGYSGNTAFMDEHNSYLIPYDLVSVGPGSAPYPPHARWAEPDLAAAAAAMRHVWEHPDEARQVADRARHDIQTRHSPAATAAQFAAAVARTRERSHGRSS